MNELSDTKCVSTSVDYVTSVAVKHGQKQWTTHSSKGNTWYGTSTHEKTIPRSPQHKISKVLSVSASLIPFYLRDSPLNVFTATVVVFFGPLGFSFGLAFCLDRRNFERRLRASRLLSRAWRANIPIASALTTWPKAPEPSTSPRIKRCSGNSQSASYGRSLHCSRRLRPGPIWNAYLLKTQFDRKLLL